MKEGEYTAGRTNLIPDFTEWIIQGGGSRGNQSGMPLYIINQILPAWNEKKRNVWRFGIAASCEIKSDQSCERLKIKKVLRCMV